VYNKIQKKVGVFEVYEFTQPNISPEKHLELIKELYVKHKILSLKYASVSITHFNNLVSQVPEPFFDKEKLPSYLQYSVKLLEDDFIAFDTIKNTEIINVYVPFVNINNFLIDVYGAFTYKHASTILIEKLLQQFKNNDKEICFINITKNQFEILVINNNKLILYNIFDFITKEDFIYYILFTLEQLKLNPEEIQIILLGDIEKESELYTILYQYVRNISFYQPTLFPEILKEVSQHSLFTLLNQF
jgi:hypothetical protein